MSNYNIVYSDTLAHYGVKGMKWGVRNDDRFHTLYGDTVRLAKKTRSSLNRVDSSYRKTKKQLKRERRDRDNRIQNNYDKGIAKIEAPYKRGQILSDKDLARQDKLENKIQKQWADSKAKYKKDLATAKANRRSQKAAINKQHYQTLNKTHSVGKAIASGLLLGAAGTALSIKSQKSAAELEVGQMMVESILGGVLQGIGAANLTTAALMQYYKNK